MEQIKNKGELRKKLFASKIKTAKVTKKEMILGYLIGPFCSMLINGILMCYLTAYYSDFLGLADSGSFLSVLMSVSAVLVVIANILTGIVIDKIRTLQGCARPFLLLSGPITFIAGILIFAVPTDNGIVKMIWVAISYNLFFSFSHAMYVTAHNSMVSLSTRDVEQRGRLSICAGAVPAASIGCAQVLFSLIRDYFLDINNGGTHARWIIVMGIVSGIAFLGAILEYYFTRERVTEESMQQIPQDIKRKTIKTRQQIKAVLSDKYWWLLIAFYFIFQFCGSMKNQSMVYYCRNVLGGNGAMSALSIVAAVPMMAGTFVVWKLANKIGKRNLLLGGMGISVLGGIISWANLDVFWTAAVGLFVKGVGLVPASYILMAMFSDMLDNIEWKHGMRMDGFVMSVYSSIMLAMPCVVTGVITFLLNCFQYDAVNQTTGIALNQLYSNCYYGVEVVGHILCLVIIGFFDLEKTLPEKRAEIKKRKTKNSV